jgi:hypothetical protein
MEMLVKKPRRGGLQNNSVSVYGVARNAQETLNTVTGTLKKHTHQQIIIEKKEEFG